MVIYFQVTGKTRALQIFQTVRTPNLSRASANNAAKQDTQRVDSRARASRGKARCRRQSKIFRQVPHARPVFGSYNQQDTRT